MWKSAHEHILKLTVYEPGKPVEELARDLGLREEEIIKLASNENPLGPSPKALEQCAGRLSVLTSIQMVEVTNCAGPSPKGSVYHERTLFLATAPMRSLNLSAMLSSVRATRWWLPFCHSFAVYKLMAQLFGADTVEVPDPEFTADLEGMLAAITPRTAPFSSPTRTTRPEQWSDKRGIDRLMARVPDQVLVIFDEAYHEFLDEPPDVLPYIRQGRNVVVMRTFSKIMGLANLRIGYGITTPELAAVLQRTRQPFNANGIAQAGALAGLQDGEHMRRTRELTHEGRRYMEREFTAMGLEFVPSFANFVLVKVGDGKEVFEAMLRKGIILRAMGSYGLPEWVRISVGTMDQNRRCIGELRELAKAGKLAVS